MCDVLRMFYGYSRDVPTICYKIVEVDIPEITFKGEIDKAVHYSNIQCISVILPTGFICKGAYY